MRKKLKRFVCWVLACFLFVLSVNWQIGNNSENKDTARVSAEESTKRATGDNWKVTIPWAEGVGYFDLSAEYGKVTFSSKAKRNIVPDKNGEGFHCLAVKWSGSGTPSVDKDFWFKVPNCGRMLVDNKYVSVDAKVFPVANNKLGTALVFQDGNKPLYFGTGAIYLNNNSTSDYLADGNSWKWKGGYNNELIMLRVEFYKKKSSGFGERISDAHGVCYMHDVEGLPSWNQSLGANMTEGFGVHAANSTIYIKDNSVHNKTTVKVGNVTFSNYYRGNAGSFNLSDSSYNEFTVGTGFHGGNYVDLVYNAAGFYDAYLDKRYARVNFNINNKSGTEPAYVSKWKGKAPSPLHLSKYTKANYKAINKIHNNVKGYDFKGWYTDSRVNENNYKEYASKKLGKNFVVENTTNLYGVYVPQNVELKVTKKWNANGTGIGVDDRKAKFRLMNGSKKLSEAEITGNGTKTVSVKYSDCLNSKGNFVAKWVEVDGTDKFLVDKSSSPANSNMNSDKVQTTTFTNTMPKINITIKKEWVGNVIPNGVNFVNVKLLRNGKVVKGAESITLSKSNNWTYNVTKPKWYGTTCDYTIEEISSGGSAWKKVGCSSSKVTGSVSNGYAVTLTAKNSIDKVKVECEKVWNDNGAVRPSSVVVKLQKSTSENGTYSSANKQATLSASNSWKTSVEMPALDSSNRRLYYRWVEETVPNGFTKSESTTRSGDNFKTVITNTGTAGSKTISVKKVWNTTAGEGTVDLPSSISVNLYKNTSQSNYGGTLVGTYSLTSNDYWSKTVSVPEKDANSNILYYYWVENSVPGFTSSTSVSGNETTITNTAKTKTVTVKKVWNDSSDESKRPYSVVVDLKRTYNGNTTTILTRNLGIANGWEASAEVNGITNLDGTDAIFFWVERDVADYNASYSTSGSVTTITNTLRPEMSNLSIEMEEIFIGDQGYESYRPSQLKYRLGVVPNTTYNKVDKIYITGANTSILVGGGYASHFYANNTYTENQFSLIEDPTDENTVNMKKYYTTEVSSSRTADTIKFTFTHVFNVVTYTELTVRKYWESYNDDYKSSDGLISLYIERSADNSSWETVNRDWKGNPISSNILVYSTISPEVTWKLPRYQSDGVTPWKYRVREHEQYSASGYTPDYVDTTGGVTENPQEVSKYRTVITNTQNKVTTTSLVIEKHWDPNMPEEIIPDEIEVEVHAHTCYRQQHADDVISVVALKKSEGWVKTVSGLKRNYHISYAETKYYVVEKNSLPYVKPDYGFGVTDPEASVDTSFSDFCTKEYDVSGLVTYSTRIYNKYNPSKTSSTVTKEWADEYPYAEKPESVSVDLLAEYAGGTTVKLKSVRLSDENNWTYTEENLVYNVPDPSNNNKIITGYSWQETENQGTWMSDWTSSVVKDGNNTVITNRGIPMSLVTVKKVWEDENDWDKLRPSSVSVGVYPTENGVRVSDTPIDTLTLSDENHWTVSKYYESRVGSLGYDCAEISVPMGYRVTSKRTSDQDGDANTTYTITLTNTHTVKIPTVAVVFQKEWEKDGYYGTFNAPAIDYDIVRLQDGEEDVVVMSKTLPPGYKAATTGNLPSMIKVDDGYVPVSYMCVEKTKVPGFTSSSVTSESYVGSELQYKTICTNTCPTVKLICEKKWVELDGASPNHADSVSLVASGAGGYTKEVVLTKDSGYYAEIDNVPTYSADGALWSNSSWSEKNCPSDYKSNISVNQLGDELHVVCTNTKASKYVSATVKKEWNDNNDAKRVRPTSVNAVLMRSGVAVKTVVLNEANNWEYTENNLPAVEGISDEYYFVEMPGSWASSYTSSSDTVVDSSSNPTKYTTTLTNTLFVPETKSISVEKKWVNASGSTPSVDVVAIDSASGAEVSDVITLSSANGYTASVSGLKKNDISGREYNYEFVELSEIAGYVSTKSVSGNKTTITNTGDITHYTTAEVRKEWVNDDANLRPSSVLVQLYMNGEEPLGDPVELNESNNWSASESNLVAYQNGKSYTYSWKEIDEFEGYTATEETVPSDSSAYPSRYVTTIRNIMGEIPLVSASVEKHWSDNNDEDGIRPDSVKVQLYKNSNIPVGSVVTLDSSNDFSYTATKLPKYSDTFTGSVIQYSFKEVDIPEGYTPGYSTSESDGNYNTVITNSYTPVPKISSTVKKVWDDEDDTDGIRPSEVEVYLERSDGTTVRSGIILSEGNNWTETVSGLPTIVDGEAVTYSYVETIVPEEYEVSYAQSGNDTTITNKYDPKREVTVIKKVPKSDIYEPFVSPSFTFKLSGTTNRGKRVEYYQMLTPVEVTSDKDNIIAKYTWVVKKGNYLLEEIPVDRYFTAEIADIEGGKKEGNAVRINFNTNGRKTATATFINRLKDYSEYTHIDTREQSLK